MLHPIQLYEREGQYWYRGGFNFAAIVALVLAVAPCVPGFLGTIKIVDPATVGKFLMHLYSYAWFVGFGIAFVVYWILMAFVRKPRSPR